MPATTSAPGGFMLWISTYGSVIGFFVQITFYIVVAGSSVWAATTFARYVKFMTGDEPVAVSSSGKVSVDEFVE